jgi:hypothetical protein
MSELFSTGALIPIWILGSGLLLGIIGWISAPRANHRH